MSVGCFPMIHTDEFTSVCIQLGVVAGVLALSLIAGVCLAKRCSFNNWFLPFLWVLLLAIPPLAIVDYLGHWTSWKQLDQAIAAEVENWDGTITQLPDGCRLYRKEGRNFRKVIHRRPFQHSVSDSIKYGVVLGMVAASIGSFAFSFQRWRMRRIRSLSE